MATVPSDNGDLEARIQQRVGARVRELRLAVGITAVVLAERTGISQGQLSKIENGKAALSVNHLARLCQFFDRPLGYLFQSFEEMPRVLGTLTTVKGPENAGIHWFAQEVRRLSGGSLTLIPLSPSQIGSAAAQVEQLKNGLIDLFMEEPFYYASFVPGFNAFALPYTFVSDSHRKAFLNGSFFRDRLIGPLRQAGIRFVNRRWNWLRGLEWVIAAKRPVVVPRDLHGLKVRIVEVGGQLMRRFWRAMGAQPVAVPWAEIGTALRDGDIDALPTHKAHLYPLKFCRHLPFVTLLGDLSPVLSIAVNEAKYQILRPDVQSALVEACDRAGDFFSRHVLQSDAKNEALNITRFNAAYLKIALDPWRTAVGCVRSG
jgi:TRAP-type C4-dicarboxylate transport system substrate-binding protein/DNA-binding Xre family transcriptional regulator